MIIVSPSILSADFADLKNELLVVKNAGAPWAHVDVMDGHFVPNISIGVPVVASLRKATDLFLDVHLMIDTPIKYVDQFIASGADMVVIHLESDTPEMIHTTLARIHELGCKAGLTVKPGTPVQLPAQPTAPESKPKAGRTRKVLPPEVRIRKLHTAIRLLVLALTAVLLAFAVTALLALHLLDQRDQQSRVGQNYHIISER